MEEKTVTSPTMQDFETIISTNAIYVDKTGYLAQLIEDAEKAWFLARPRRFAKSLTVSTLEAIFSGKKELFKGLAIENRLDEELFAPRPVIRLDMSEIRSNCGVDTFNTTLSNEISNIANLHGVEVSNELEPNLAFSSLIERCHQKSGQRVAILIDEYDSPATAHFNNPYEMEKFHISLQDFYRQLKTNSKYISFVFVTGVTKLIVGGLYSGFNNFIDISTDTQYGALTGFTHEEILRYYPYQIREVAASLKMSENMLLSIMKKYYGGYCFDGKTLVYNHNSILCLFESKEFRNFWYRTGIPNQLKSFLRNRHLKIKQFRNYSISKERIESPSDNRFNDPEAYLFQLGFLSLRPCDSEDYYLLDYPNVEVRKSLKRRIL
ncbi:MAG: AAA family ATPase, partial [Deltaproteobacteria bacterium]|nr:AAA family ATPase [Deltaproteobacteria bacterium]